MPITLCDVSFLVALLHRNHARNDVAYSWWRSNRRDGWATCPITLNGCIRLLMNPVMGLTVSPRELIERITRITADPHHIFWPDSVSLTDATLFNHAAIRGHKQITDVYLLGLAVRNGGRLATFDNSIALEAVRGATAEHLVLL